MWKPQTTTTLLEANGRILSAGELGQGLCCGARVTMSHCIHKRTPSPLTSTRETHTLLLMEKASIGIISAWRGLLACLIAFLVLLKVIAPVNSIGWASTHRIDAGWSVDNFDVRAPCSAKQGRSDSPAHGDQDHTECICCASSPRDNLSAIGGSLVEIICHLIVFDKDYIAYFDYRPGPRRMLGWLSAWSSRAPPPTA